MDNSPHCPLADFLSPAALLPTLIPLPDSPIPRLPKLPVFPELPALPAPADAPVLPECTPDIPPHGCVVGFTPATPAFAFGFSCAPRCAALMFPPDGCVVVPVALVTVAVPEFVTPLSPDIPRSCSLLSGP